MAETTHSDAFLSYNRLDKSKAEKVAKWLEAQEVGVWYDMWELRPGFPWLEAIREGFEQSFSVVVFFGPSGLGLWQEKHEVRWALEKSRNHGCPVIPILLPGCPDPEESLEWLKDHPGVDFRAGLDDADAKKELLDRVVGKRSILEDLHGRANAFLREKTEAQIKRILLKKVNERWVGTLEFYGEKWLDIGRERMEGVVDPPEWMRSRERKASPGVERKDPFIGASGDLLILGDPGMGKTFSLLELARRWSHRAMHDPTRPVPVILNLSSWNMKHLTIANWLVRELKHQYGISKDLADAWVRDARKPHLFYLLDGLDEVAAGLRKACVRAINQFREKYRQSRIVVTSRRLEYMETGVTLNMEEAFVLKTLSMEQIENHLPKGLTISDLRLVTPTENDREFQKLMTPLVLDILRYIPMEHIKTVKSESVDEFHGRLFELYIERMFDREMWTKEDWFPKEETIRNLSWLARRMQRFNQSEFYLEKLQPTWLSGLSQTWGYMIGSRMIVGLILAITLCASVAMLDFGAAVGKIGFALKFGVISGVIVGLLSTIEGGLRLEITGETHRAPGKSIGSFSRGQLYSFCNILCAGIISAWILGWSATTFFVGVVVAGANGAIFQGRMRAGDSKEDIRTIERITWWWTNAIGTFLLVLVMGPIVIGAGELLFQLLFSVSFGQLVANTFELSGGPSGGWLFLWLFGSFYIGLLSGLYGKKRTIRDTDYPNQMIWLSGRNAVLAGFIVFSVLFLTGLVFGFSTFTSVALTFSVIMALVFGGLSFVQHFSLRFIMARNGPVSLQYTVFLDYGVERIFLRKIGGGYIFIHNLLRDHFASMEHPYK